MLCLLPLWCGLSAAWGQTELEVSNQSPREILIWVKRWHEPRWPEPTPLPAGQTRSYPLHARGALDIRVRYFTADGAMIDRTAMRVDVDQLAANSRARSATAAMTVESHITGRWLKSQGQWVRSRTPRDGWPWTFRGEHGKVRIELPQDATFRSVAESSAMLDAPLRAPASR